MTFDELKNFKMMAYGRINAANCHELLNQIGALGKFIELVEDFGHPASKFQGVIDNTVNKINLILRGDLSKMKSKKHQFPSWTLINGD